MFNTREILVRMLVAAGQTLLKAQKLLLHWLEEDVEFAESESSQENRAEPKTLNKAKLFLLGWLEDDVQSEESAQNGEQNEEEDGVFGESEKENEVDADSDAHCLNEGDGGNQKSVRKMQR